MQSRQVSFLLQSHKDEAWDETDVPKDGANLTPMVLDAWVGLARDGSKTLKVDFTTNDGNRIKMWLTRLVGGGEKLDGAKDGMASKKIAPASEAVRGRYGGTRCVFARGYCLSRTHARPRTLGRGG